MSYLELLNDTSLWTQIPIFLVWSVGVVIGIILVRRKYGKRAVLFLIGSGCLLLADLGRPFLLALARYAYESGPSLSYHNLATAIALIEGLPVLVLTVAGFTCLAAAFLLAFLKKREAAGP